MSHPAILRQDARNQAIGKVYRFVLGTAVCIGIGLAGAAMLSGSVDCSTIARNTASHFVSASMPKLVKLPFS